MRRGIGQRKHIDRHIPNFIQVFCPWVSVGFVNDAIEGCPRKTGGPQAARERLHLAQ